MDNKMLENKTDKENTSNTAPSEKTAPTTETTRPLHKRRSRRRLPAW
jgi:hypothetical protein